MGTELSYTPANYLSLCSLREPWYHPFYLSACSEAGFEDGNKEWVSQYSWAGSRPQAQPGASVVQLCGAAHANVTTLTLLFPITLESGSPWLRFCSPLSLAPWMSAQAALRPVPPGSDPALHGDASVPAWSLTVQSPDPGAVWKILPSAVASVPILDAP